MEDVEASRIDIVDRVGALRLDLRREVRTKDWRCPRSGVAIIENNSDFI